MTLDEASAALMAEMAQAGRKPIETMTPEDARKLAASLRRQPERVPALAESSDRRIPVSGGSIRLRLLSPEGSINGVIVYYHGGGWVVGSIEDSDVLGRTLAQRSQCLVVLADYRMAPEYRFPTAVDDAYASLCWVNERMEEIAGRRLPIVVAGDSAGGNLAAAVTIRARDRRGPKIAMQVLVYPVTDCDFATTSYVDPDNALLLTRESMIWFWDQYAPDLAGRNHPEASPLRVGDASRLPPAVVLTAEHDVLRAEGEIYATRLLKSGVPVEFHRFEGQMHGFLSMMGVLPGSEAAISCVVDAVRRTLAEERIVENGSAAP